MFVPFTQPNLNKIPNTQITSNAEIMNGYLKVLVQKSQAPGIKQKNLYWGGGGTTHGEGLCIDINKCQDQSKLDRRESTQFGPDLVC